MDILRRLERRKSRKLARTESVGVAFTQEQIDFTLKKLKKEAVAGKDVSSTQIPAEAVQLAGHMFGQKGISVKKYDNKSRKAMKRMLAISSNLTDVSFEELMTTKGASIVLCWGKRNQPKRVFRYRPLSAFRWVAYGTLMKNFEKTYPTFVENEIKRHKAAALFPDPAKCVTCLLDDRVLEFELPSSREARQLCLLLVWMTRAHTHQPMPSNSLLLWRGVRLRLHMDAALSGAKMSSVVTKAIKSAYDEEVQIEEGKRIREGMAAEM